MEYESLEYKLYWQQKQAYNDGDTSIISHQKIILISIGNIYQMAQ